MQLYLWYVILAIQYGYNVADAVVLADKFILYQIDQEREGEQIDRALLKNVLDIFVEIGMGHMDCYENDFEAAMLKDTAAYYSRKASNWILEDSCPDYMLKVFNLFFPWLNKELTFTFVIHFYVYILFLMVLYVRLRSVLSEKRTGFLIIYIQAVRQSCWRLAFTL